MENYTYPIIILSIFLLIVIYKEIRSYYHTSMEEKVTNYFNSEGFEWKLHNYEKMMYNKHCV